MSDLVRCRFCDSCFKARELIAKVTALILRLVYSGVTERTIGKRVFIALSLSLHFSVNC